MVKNSNFAPIAKTMETLMTDKDVLEISMGECMNKLTDLSDEGWYKQKGTIFDYRIFGYPRDNERSDNRVMGNEDSTEEITPEEKILQNKIKVVEKQMRYANWGHISLPIPLLASSCYTVAGKNYLKTIITADISSGDKKGSIKGPALVKLVQGKYILLAPKKGIPREEAIKLYNDYFDLFSEKEQRDVLYNTKYFLNKTLDNAHSKVIAYEYEGAKQTGLNPKAHILAISSDLIAKPWNSKYKLETLKQYFTPMVCSYAIAEILSYINLTKEIKYMENLINKAQEALDKILAENAVLQGQDSVMGTDEDLERAIESCSEAIENSEIQLGIQAMDNLLPIGYKYAPVEYSKTVGSFNNLANLEKRIKTYQKRYEILKGFVKQGIHPVQSILTKIPVMPAGYRDRQRVASDSGVSYTADDINDVYNNLIGFKSNIDKRFISKATPEEILRYDYMSLEEQKDLACRLDNFPVDNTTIINAIKRAQETFDWLTKTKVDPKGIKKTPMDKVIGKYGRFRKNMEGKRLDYTGTGVIVPDPTLRINQIGVPYRILIAHYGKEVKDAYKRVYNEPLSDFMMENIDKDMQLVTHFVSSFSDRRMPVIPTRDEEEQSKEMHTLLVANRIHKILTELVAGDRYINIRFPTLWKYNVMGYKIVITYDYAIKFHPLLCSSYNADFDGDRDSLYRVDRPDTVKEVDSILLPSKNAIDMNGNSFHVPSQDAVLGLYFLTRNARSSKICGVYQNYSAMYGDYLRGKLDLRDRVIVYVNDPQYCTFKELYGRYNFERKNVESILLNSTVNMNEEVTAEDDNIADGEVDKEKEKEVQKENNTTNCKVQAMPFGGKAKPTHPITSTVGRFILNSYIPQDMNFKKRPSLKDWNDEVEYTKWFEKNFKPTHKTEEDFASKYKRTQLDEMDFQEMTQAEQKVFLEEEKTNIDKFVAKLSKKHVNSYIKDNYWVTLVTVNSQTPITTLEELEDYVATLRAEEDNYHKDSYILRNAYNAYKNETLYGLEWDDNCGMRGGLTKKDISKIVKHIDYYTEEDVQIYCKDWLKTLGYKYATIIGITIGLNDIVIAPEKDKMVEDALRKDKQIREKYKDDHAKLVTHLESHWFDVTNKIGDVTIDEMDEDNNLKLMITTKARGSKDQVKQIAGVRGLMKNPDGTTRLTPITECFGGGMSPTGFADSSYGSRASMADRSNKTKDTGDTTRHLAHSLQMIVISKGDCGDREGYLLKNFHYIDENDMPAYHKLIDELDGRYIIDDVVDEDGKILIPAGFVISPMTKSLIEGVLPKVQELYGEKGIKVRSPLGCKCTKGICAKCYGYNFSKNRYAVVGDNVGIVTAQGIGEKGTQTVMRNFHTGGIAGGDTNQGFDYVMNALMNGVIYPIINKYSKFLTMVNSKNIELTREYMKEMHKYIKYHDIKNLEELNATLDKTLTYKDEDKEKYLTFENFGLTASKLYFEMADEIIIAINKTYSGCGFFFLPIHYELLATAVLDIMFVVDRGDTSYNVGADIRRGKMIQTNLGYALEGKDGVVVKPLFLNLKKIPIRDDSLLGAIGFQYISEVVTFGALKASEDDMTSPMSMFFSANYMPVGKGIVTVKEAYKVNEPVISMDNLLKLADEVDRDVLGLDFNSSVVWEVGVEEDDKSSKSSKPKQTSSSRQAPTVSSILQGNAQLHQAQQQQTTTPTTSSATWETDEEQESSQEPTQEQEQTNDGEQDVNTIFDNLTSGVGWETENEQPTQTDDSDK